MLYIHIKGNYGHLRLPKQEYEAKEKAGTLTPLEREQYHEPGPFSVVTYVENLLKLSFFGEEIAITVTSMMWQLRVTVLAADSLIQTRIRHSNKLSNADLILIRTKQLHYIPAG